jgi:hypothetical protein
MTVLAALRRSPRGAVLRTRFIFQRHLKSATANRRALIEKGVGIERCFDFAATLRKVLVKLFQKLAEHETASRLNARASALAGVLQKAEALLLLFGQSRCFPNVGKRRALSLPLISRHRAKSLMSAIIILLVYR